MMKALHDTITVKQAAERYKCCTKTILRRARQKKFEVRRPGRHIQIVVESADAWYESTKDRI